MIYNLQREIRNHYYFIGKIYKSFAVNFGQKFAAKWLVSVIVLFISFENIHAQYTDSVYIDSADYKAVGYKNVKLEFQRKHLYAPSLLFISGLALNSNHPESFKNKIVIERNKHFPNFHTGVDDYLQFTPIVLSFGLDAFGIPSKTDIGNRTAILLKAELLMFGSVHILKRSIGQERPNNGAKTSFPSGHTAQAFVAATFLSEEYKERYPWMPYLAYGIASSVGTLRMANNRHYISDVLFGAGLGILSVKFSYWTHRYKWGFKK